MTESSQANRNPAAEGWFSTTHWTTVLATRHDDPAKAAAALEKLCRAYWPPLYAYIRREGHDATNAEDLTQGFFACLLERRSNWRQAKRKWRRFGRWC